MSEYASPTANPSTVGPLVTELGRVWEDRWQVSERYFKANSYDWDALYRLYSNVYEQRNRWGTGVSIAWSVIQNIVEDSIPALPEPWIMPRSTNIDPDVPKMLRDLAKTIHKHCDTHDKMKRARILCGYSAMPAIWPAFYQVSAPLYDAEQLAAHEDGGGTGEPPEPVGYAAKQQLIDVHLCSGWDMRYDPYGREWDLSDHKWIGKIYYPTVQEVLDDPDFINKDVFLRWARNRMAERRNDNAISAYSVGYDEKDLRYLHVEMAEIWSMAEFKRIWKPVGARFHVGEADWPEEFKEAGVYPCVPVAVNWEGDDRRGKKGFYAVPDLRLIRSQLENLNRLEGLYVDAATNSVKKYFYPDGIFDDKAFTKIQSDVNREFIGINWQLLKSKLGVATGQEWNPAQIDLRALIQLMPTESREEALKHEEAMNHELEMIYQIIGQSAADRGGAMALAKSATQAIQIGQGQQRRLAAQAEQLAGFIDKVTERIFLLLKAHQTLPIQYLATGDYANDSTWKTFLAEDIEQFDLAFYHHTGSSQPIDRDQYRFEIREIITQILPLVAAGQVSPETRFLIRELFSTYDVPGLDHVFNDQVPGLVEQGLAMLDAVQTGQAQPTDPTFAMTLVAVFAQLVNALASPAQVQKVAAASAGEEVNVARQGQGQGQPTASLRGSRSPGQAAAASAGAGVVGGVN